MASSLSQLSSLTEEDPPLYVQPHYKESYRLAIYALLCGGREAYEEFLRAEQISPFLSEQEILFMMESGELPEAEDDGELKRSKDAAAPSTYFPSESDEEVPDLELGWPEVSLEATDTSISLLFNPPRINTPSIKEVVRKQIQEARQVKPTQTSTHKPGKQAAPSGFSSLLPVFLPHTLITAACFPFDRVQKPRFHREAGSGSERWFHAQISRFGTFLHKHTSARLVGLVAAPPPPLRTCGCRLAAGPGFLLVQDSWQISQNRTSQSGVGRRAWIHPVKPNI